MKKRDFLTRCAVASMLPAAPALAAPAGPEGPVLLTISGALGRTNRPGLDPAMDQMMHKHGIGFDKAFGFDARALARLPQVRIKPTLEYDALAHTLSGPLLSTVLEAVGVAPDRSVQLGLRAVDGYNVQISLHDARAYRMLIATHADAKPLALGGLGPQWAVFDADNLAPFKDKPLKERFALCPWGLYHIGVAPA